MKSASPVSNVSDTARWVAVYRAWESARPDALFHDPHAKSLAGERGEAIAKLMPAQTRSGWPMVARTKIIDDLVQEKVVQGCDCVINLAAGLDTRPYRLELPETLRWIEADLPALIEEKEALLADVVPRCQLRRISATLTNAPLKFAPENGVAFFEAIGWRVAEVHSIFHAAVRYRRLPWFLRIFSLLPKPNPRKLGGARWSAVVELTRAN